MCMCIQITAFYLLLQSLATCSMPPTLKTSVTGGHL